MPHLREHKSFSEIEADINRFYDDGTVGAYLTALKVAGRALAVALVAAPESDARAVRIARQLVFDLLLDLEGDRAVARCSAPDDDSDQSRR